MKNCKLSSLIIPLLILGCNSSDKKSLTTNIQPSKSSFLNSNINLLDTIILQESLNQEDLFNDEYLSKELQPIRVNFKRINSIKNWSSIQTRELWNTTEGGEAKYYYLNGQLEKITTRHFGETFQQLTEYYLLNGKLSFVFARLYKYNRPMYYDSPSMKENNDNEVFVFIKSEIIEDRSYFSNEKLIHQINNQDCGSPFADDYLLEEQIRIKVDFKNLIELTSLK